MCFGYTVAAPYLHIDDRSILQELIACFLADAQSIGHLVDVHYIGIILEHHSISISRREIQRFPFFPYGSFGCRTLPEQPNEPFFCRICHASRQVSEETGDVTGCGWLIRIIALPVPPPPLAYAYRRNSPSSLWEVVRKYHYIRAALLRFACRSKVNRLRRSLWLLPSSRRPVRRSTARGLYL